MDRKKQYLIYLLMFLSLLAFKFMAVSHTIEDFAIKLHCEIIANSSNVDFIVIMFNIIICICITVRSAEIIASSKENIIAILKNFVDNSYQLVFIQMKMCLSVMIQDFIAYLVCLILTSYIYGDAITFSGILIVLGILIVFMIVYMLLNTLMILFINESHNIVFVYFMSLLTVNVLISIIWRIYAKN